MNQFFNSIGVRYYDSNEPDLTARTVNTNDGPAPTRTHTVYGIQCLTDSVLHSDTTFANGYDGDTALIGKTLLAGKDYFFRFSRVKFTSGTGLLLLEQ